MENLYSTQKKFQVSELTTPSMSWTWLPEWAEEVRHSGQDKAAILDLQLKACMLMSSFPASTCTLALLGGEACRDPWKRHVGNRCMEAISRPQQDNSHYQPNFMGVWQGNYHMLLVGRHLLSSSICVIFLHNILYYLAYYILIGLFYCLPFFSRM